jgi:hypothetical protein
VLLYELDTERASDLPQLKRLILGTADLSTAEETARRLDAATTPNELLLKNLADGVVRVLRRRRNGTTAVAAQPDIPGGGPPSWESLAPFAERLPRRGAGERPHPVLDHLRQRLGDAQRGRRPAVRARCGPAAPDGSGEVVTVTRENYQPLLVAAAANPWAAATLDRATLRSVLESWTPVDVAGLDDFDEGALSASSTLADMDGSEPEPRVPYATSLTTAWRRINEWVDPEVLRVVGLPTVVIRGNKDEQLGSRAAFYDEQTRSIHIHHDKVTPAHLLHEFGHHVEEQGPVEIWCALVCLLGRLSGGRPLAGARDLSSREPTYDYDFSLGKLPKSTYALSYYADGGTELLAVGLENDVLAGPRDFIDWDDIPLNQNPDYVALVLWAFRPQVMREEGMTLPILLP